TPGLCKAFNSSWEDWSITPGLCKAFNSSWEEWSSWTDCSVTCGFGTSTRYRVWKKDGIILDFTFRDIRECWVQAHCPVHGSWGRWSDWDSCTAMCNGGVHRRGRVCNFPVPQHGGRDCDGAKWEKYLLGSDFHFALNHITYVKVRNIV
ncbi:hypothetical protein KUTeg_012581, partial [Tegillarca granosa]